MLTEDKIKEIQCDARLQGKLCLDKCKQPFLGMNECHEHKLSPNVFVNCINEPGNVELDARCIEILD